MVAQPTRPKLLDLFCGAGGAAADYHRAGFNVTGVDISPQKRYPFTFIQADALEYVAAHGHEYDAIHASSPCQAYSIMRNLPWLRDKEYPRLLEPTRNMLQAAGLPYVIENVMGARLIIPEAAWLCGSMFGLPFFRHRLFATNWLLRVPAHPKHQHTIRNGPRRGSRARDIVHNGAARVGANVGHAAGVQDARQAMGIDWMTRDEITQAIPPASTEYIGRQLLAAMRSHQDQEGTYGSAGG